MSKSIYTKLTPTNRSFFGYTQLWLAPDHILLLTSSRFAEDYKRFAIAEIESIVVTDLPSRLPLQVILILAALAWISLSFTVNSMFAKGAFLITGTLALLWPILDIARGPRCRCFLYTRVSKELLAPVSRTRIAQTFLATLRPMIEAAQGLMPEQFTAIETSAPFELPPPQLVSPPGYVPEILFGLFLVNAVILWSLTRFPASQELFGVLLNTMIAEVMLIVVALLRRKGRDNRVIIYVLMVVCVAGIAFDSRAVGRGVVTWYMTLLEKAKHGDRSATLMSLFPPGTHDAVIAYSWRAAAGVLGLAAAFWERRSSPK